MPTNSLRYSLVALVFTIIAALIAFSGIEGEAAIFAWITFCIFALISLAFLIMTSAREVVQEDIRTNSG